MLLGLLVLLGWATFLVGMYACVAWLDAIAVHLGVPEAPGRRRLAHARWAGWGEAIAGWRSRHKLGNRGWRALRERYRLRTVHGDPRFLEGRVDGSHLEVRAVGGGSAPGLRIRLDLHDPLPRGLRVERRNGAGRGGERLGDLILDLTLRTTGDPAPLRARLVRPEIRQALLEVVHGADRGALTDASIEVELAGPVPDPEPWVERVIALERGLRAA